MECTISTDDLHLQLYRLFLQDMRIRLEDPSFMLGADTNIRSEQPYNYLCSPIRFKARHQAACYFKRFIRTGEGHDLKTATIQKFIAVQHHLDSVLKRNRSYRASLVLREARKYIRSILGGVDPFGSPEQFRFGKRAAIGLPYSDSYLDVRIRRLTGSPPHIDWFSKFAADDQQLLAAIAENNSFYCETQHLVADYVPKKWDISRLILKNTQIGALYTAGLGGTIVKAWKEKGYDLYSRAEYHRAIVEEYSITRSHSTGDLQSASDCYLSALLNALLPRKWFRAIMFGRIPLVDLGVDGSLSRINSVMTMGVGYTFPLQSLCFYAILHGIRHLSRIRGKISVFGDDLIYPTPMHNMVNAVLTDLGFIMNNDKTFTNAEFRESCGADYYCGHDVRPYMPQGVAGELVNADARAYLHKTINGWLARWKPWEIPSVISYLESKLLLFGPIYQVPADFPDTAGVKLPVVTNLDYYKQPERNGNGSLVAEYLSNKVPLRQVRQTRVYYWNCLREMSIPLDISCPFSMDPLDDPVLRAIPTTKSVEKRRVFCKKHGLPKRMLKDNRLDGNLPTHLRSRIPPLRLRVFVGRKAVPTNYISQKCVTPHWDYVSIGVIRR